MQRVEAGKQGDGDGVGGGGEGGGVKLFWKIVELFICKSLELKQCSMGIATKGKCAASAVPK